MAPHLRMDRVGIGHERRAPVVIDGALGIARRARGVVERDGVPFVLRRKPLERLRPFGEKCLIVDLADGRTLA